MKYFLCFLLSAILCFIVVALLFFNRNNFVIIDHVNFQTKKKEFTFTVTTAKGRDVQMMERRFQDFKVENPEYKNLKLYRTTPINYLKIGKWVGYRANPAWTYPKLPFWKR